jgi:FKBP-type peptidyl-prolyl cis-trans isomerase (trigger factor)
MRVKTSQPKDGRITLSVSADAQEVDAGIAYLIAKCAAENSVEIGDSPDLEFAVRARIGQDFLQAYIDLQLPMLLAGRAIGHEHLETILNPELLKPLPLVTKGKGLDFRASVILKPRYTLSSYEPVTVSVKPVTVSESELDDQMLMLAENFATFDLDESGQPDPDSRVIPAVTDVWVSENIPGATSVPELRELLRQNALAFKRDEQQEYVAYAASSELARRLVGEISDEVFDLTQNDLLSALQKNLAAQGRSLIEFVQSQGGDRAFSAHMRQQTIEVLRQGFALDALARHLELTVTAADLEDAFARMAPGHEDIAYLDFQQTGRMYIMEEAALRIKTNLHLVETARIIDLVDNEEADDPAEQTGPDDEAQVNQA